ncbi:hypothetical protein TNIN_212671 [Trichonephila inaurata madagascariensis]|uniref:Uncharacterized protein n=1 Tax=Trichonephila inaurata madagascariensis TaxID=2747483 RepID=A0A8X6WUC8_9ARAC|nr:hypothetical protein TNIN_212671 [Trichonephila inaurata madagascariensis]
MLTHSHQLSLDSKGVGESWRIQDSLLVRLDSFIDREDPFPSPPHGIHSTREKHQHIVAKCSLMRDEMRREPDACSSSGTVKRNSCIAFQKRYHFMHQRKSPVIDFPNLHAIRH